MLATLFLAQGTPMLLGGDEFGRTQLGNNNAYCQDNEISWLDWSLLETPEGRELCDFVRHLSRVRRDFVTLQAGRFLNGDTEVMDGVHEVDWFDERGQALLPDDWQNPEGRALVMRRARRPEDKEGAEAEVTLLFINGDLNPITCQVPAPAADWHCLLNSATPGQPCQAVEGPELVLEGKSVVLFANRALEARHG
jgi:glycogen operon protein